MTAPQEKVDQLHLESSCLLLHCRRHTQYLTSVCTSEDLQCCRFVLTPLFDSDPHSFVISYSGATVDVAATGGGGGPAEETKPADAPVNANAGEGSTGAAGCQHMFCRECVGGYVSSMVSSGVVLHPCPLIGRDGCSLTYRSVSRSVHQK